MLAAQLRQVLAGDDADLGRQVLHEHRDEVRRDQDPDEKEAVLRAAGDVGGEVARVDVGHRGHEGRSEQRDPPAELPARAHAREVTDADERRWKDGGVSPCRGGRRRVHAPTSTRIAWARSPPSGCTSPPKRTNSGPPNGCRSTTSKAAPGVTPRSPR